GRRVARQPGLYPRRVHPPVSGGTGREISYVTVGRSYAGLSRAQDLEPSFTYHPHLNAGEHRRRWVPGAQRMAVQAEGQVVARTVEDTPLGKPDQFAGQVRAVGRHGVDLVATTQQERSDRA